MSILTPAVISAFDDLVKSESTLLDVMTVWHCGSLRGSSSLRVNEGLWVYKSAEKSRTHAGSAVRDFRLQAVPTTPPYFTEMTIGPKGLRMANFDGASTHDITTTYFNGQHHKAKMALTEWAKRRGFDLIMGTNGGGDEVVVVHPDKHIRFEKCQDLLTGKWGRKVVHQVKNTPDEDSLTL